MYGNSGGDTSSQPAPADKSQRDSFKQNAQKVGLVQTEKGEQIVVRDYVYSTLWKHVKFVTNESELDFEGLIAKTVMREVNVANDDTVRQEFWARNQCKVLKWVNQKRNNTIGAVKKEFISKYCTRYNCSKYGLLTSLVMLFFLYRMGD
jgi:hypothetical protein